MGCCGSKKPEENPEPASNSEPEVVLQRTDDYCVTPRCSGTVEAKQ